MQLSKLAEVSALSSTQKPVVTPAQIAGHEWTWSRDNIDNAAYLLLNPIINPVDGSAQMGPLNYTQSAQVPPALAALLQVTELDMQDLLGLNKTGADDLKAGISGKAVELIQSRVDGNAAIYMDNFRKALKRSGEVWLAMAQELYVEPGRKMKTMSADGSTGQVELYKPVILADGTQGFDNVLEDQKWDVFVEVGPSSQSRRDAIIRNITSMLGFVEDPATKSVLISTAIANLDGEGFGDIRAFFRKQLVAQGVVSPTEEEAAAMASAQQPQVPDAQQILMAKMAEEAEAKAAKARADTMRQLADAERLKAVTQKTMAETQSLEMDTILKVGSE
jgi:hypothetical protein